MSRRLAVLVLVVLAVPAVALAAATDPKRQIDPGDQRKAAAIVLKRADFAPGWRKAANAPDGDKEYTCRGYNPDQSDLVLTGEVEARFQAAGGTLSVFSISNIYRTRREAIAAWTRSDRPELVPCVAQTLKRQIESDGGKATVAGPGKIAFPRLAPRTSAYRFSLDVTFVQAGKPTRVPLTIHMIALGDGRGDAFMMSIGLGNGMPPAELRALAKVVAARLAAAKL